MQWELFGDHLRLTEITSNRDPFIARHCVFLNHTIYIGAGLDHDPEKILSSPSNCRQVHEFYVYQMEKLEFLRHSASSFDLRSDIALLQMREPWIFNDQTNIYPACLSPFDRQFYGGGFLAAGFGQTYPENRTKQVDSHTGLQPSSGRNERLLMTKLQLFEVRRYLVGLSNPQSSVCYGI